MTKIVNLTCKKNVKTTQKLSISIFERTSISPYSVQMRENTDQKTFKYGHFSRSGKQRKMLDKWKSYHFASKNKVYISKFQIKTISFNKIKNH